ncbi:MAG: hypothetical protein KJ044_04870 [Planctomycetes bacterium]|nr:hypothetical protein [Planctomycetota bacterium]
MEPLEVCHKAGYLANQGDLQAAIDLLDPLIESYRDFGPAYVVHARVFLMAGDAAQAMVDLDAADWANREYGTQDQRHEVTELRAVAHAIRTIYGAKPEAEKCKAAIEELIRQKCPSTTLWLLPATCYEHLYKVSDAEAWLKRLAPVKELKSPLSMYFAKPGLTQLLAMPKNVSEAMPVHFARHLRAKREGDRKGAEKYAKRMAEVLQPGDLWGVLYLYAAGETTLNAA